MSRDRVQSIALWEHTFDFHLGFAMVFESTTEPQREAQNDLSECTNLITIGILQRISNRARKKCYKSADFWGRGWWRADPLEKTRGLESTCAPDRSENISFCTKGRKHRAGGEGHVLNPGRHSV